MWFDYRLDILVFGFILHLSMTSQGEQMDCHVRSRNFYFCIIVISIISILQILLCSYIVTNVSSHLKQL